MMKSAWALAAFAVLAACDPISEDQCRAGNWSGLGLKDGQKGLTSDRFDTYAQVCSEYGIQPARLAYMQARQLGLQTYCTPDTAYDVGRDGDRLSGVCTPEQHAAMKAPFNHGRNYYEISQEIDDKESQILSLRSEIESYPEAPDSAQQAAIDDARSRIRRLDNRIFRLNLERRRYSSWP